MIPGEDSELGDASTPADLLHALLAELAGGDAVAAARHLHAVSTPRFQGRVGSPADLARYLSNPLHAPLLGHVDATPGPIHTIQDAARQRLEVRSAEGAPVAYLLSYKRGDDGVWLVSGLVREDVALR